MHGITLFDFIQEKKLLTSEYQQNKILEENKYLSQKIVAAFHDEPAKSAGLHTYIGGDTP